MDDSLVPQFVQSYYAAQAALLTGNKAQAMSSYQGLLGLYKQIASSSLAKPHKDLAHQQVQSIYADLARMSTMSIKSEPVSQVAESTFLSGLGLRDFATLGFFAVLIMLVLFFKPEYIGLTTYDVVNYPPEWTGKDMLFAAPVGLPISIELKDKFSDADGNALTYLATSTPAVEVSVKGSIVTISSANLGDHIVMVMASDSESITKVPLTIRVV